MKKLSAASLLIALLAVVLFFPNGKKGNTWNPIPAERAEYVEFFNNYLKNMPQVEPGMDKRNSPDMFYEFDKLKRLDPATGEVPADGLVKAWKNVQKQFGETSMARTNYSLQWIERGPSTIGGRTRAIMWDPNDQTNKAVFAGGVGGGLWYNTDITNSNSVWSSVSSLFSNVAVTHITHDPSNTQIMYYGTGEGWNNADALRGAGIWKSVDGGMSWDQLASTANPEFYFVQKVAVTSNGTLYAATKNGLHRTKDGGQTWERVLGLGFGAGNDWITDFDIAGNGDLFASINSNGIYKSAASLGATQGDSSQWTRLSLTFPTGYDRIETAVGVTNSNYIYTICEANNVVAGSYRSTNGGTSFTNMPGQPNGGGDYSNGQAWYDLCLDIDPNDHNTVYTGAIDQYRTTNAGTNWFRLTDAYGATFGQRPYMHPDQHVIVVNPANSNQVLFGHDGGVWYSSDKGNSVSSRNNGYNITQYYSIAVDPRAGSNILIGGTQDNGSSMVNQAGIGPGIGLTGSDGGFCAIDYLRPDTLYTSTQYRTIRRSRNGGFSFQAITNTALTNNDVLFINPLEIDHNDPKIMYMASRSLWRRNNAASGGTGGWLQATVNLGSNITAIGISESTPNLVYIGVGGSVYRLPNAQNANFNSQPTEVNASGGGNGYVSCVAVNPVDGNHVVAVYSSYGLTRKVVETRDAQLGANASWKNLSGNLPDVPVNWAVYEPNNPNGMVVGTDLGAFRCGDVTLPEADIFWSPASAGMGWPRIDMLRVRKSDNSIHAGTHGRGFFSTYSYQNQPSALFGVVSDSACGGTVEFIDSTSSAPSSWSWTFGDGGTSTVQNPQHTYGSSGTYTVTLTTTNANGTDTYSQSLNVVVLPGVTAVGGPDIDACPGDTVQLSASGGVAYEWFPNFGLDNATSATPNYEVSGTRTFVVTVYDQYGCSDQDTVVVTQQAAPNTWAGQDKTITMVNDSVQLTGFGGVTYEWTPTIGLSCTTCPDPMAYPPTTTTYTLTAYNAAGCSRSDQVIVNVNIMVGLDDDLGEEVVLHPVRPNPVSDHFTVDFSLLNAMDVRIDLVDLQGKVLSTMSSGMESAGDHSIRWERENGLSAGVYFVRMQAGGLNLVNKVVLLNN